MPTQKKQRPIWLVRLTVQLLMLAFFGLLLYTGKLQLWFAVFAFGVLLSPFLGRLYCGWLCPMHTLFRPVSWFYTKTKLKRLPMPQFLIRHPWLRIIPLVIFGALMIVMRRSGVTVPILAFMTIAAFLLTLIFEEAFWHNTFCPFGTLLSVSSRLAIGTYRIRKKQCIACGKCQTVCPVHVIDTVENGKRRIRTQDCISCGKCGSVCPTRAIQFSRKTGN